MSLYRNYKGWLAVFFFCFSLLAVFLSGLTAKAGDENFSSIADFQSIVLSYAGADGQPEGDAIQDNTLIAKDRNLVLRYTYEITADQSKNIVADTRYYLNVSPHLTLPDLKDGSALILKDDQTPVEFGKIYADGKRAWVSFYPNGSGSTILADYDGIADAYFYLNCGRADTPPANEPPITGHHNLYAMKFENGKQLIFGYEENEPVLAKAEITKDGSLTDRTISWSIEYTPWQNPSEKDNIAMDTPFELRDTIDTALHSYVEGSVRIDNAPVQAYASRNEITGNPDVYMIVETSKDKNSTVLIFGGTKFNAGNATLGNPAKPLTITYQTFINSSLLLPEDNGDKKITNTAELFAGEHGAFNSLSVRGQKTVPVPQPTWFTKTGETQRHTDGSGSTTVWTVTFDPHGLSFTGSDALTLYDRLPDGSTLVTDSVEVENQNVAVTDIGGNAFTVSPIEADGHPVHIVYQTKAGEDMYDNGLDLGSNTAWFTFRQEGRDYKTPQVITPVDSGHGSGSSGTAVLVKENTGYDPATRSTTWTVTINPHRVYLKSGTFADPLGSVGDACNNRGHASGLELADGVKDVSVLIDGHEPADSEKNLVALSYNQKTLTVTIGDIGTKTVTLCYTTRVCDPCIFANNTKQALFKNTISTKDMIIGKNATEPRSASADSTAIVSATVLTKNAPVYDYVSGTMEWSVEVDAAGLSMSDVVLTDDLPIGFTYIDGSLTTTPEVKNARAETAGQELTIFLDTVTQKTNVAFKTKVNPEVLGFGGDKPVVVENTIYMNGFAEGIKFTDVFHKIRHNFSNHGLVKSSTVNSQEELIRYEVLINPFGLSLPGNPSLVDTLDKRLQLDTDTLLFYKATLSGTTAGVQQKPQYTLVGPGQKLKISGYDPDTNSFTVELPITALSRDAYVLAYTADILHRQTDAYSNSVRFEGGTVLLGGNKDNSAAVNGGGGGGGVASRKASITIINTEPQTQNPLAGMTFTLYQWDKENNKRGLPFAQGTTDAQGRLSFKVTPGSMYELVETGSIPGYSSVIGWTELPPNITATQKGLLITAGAAKSQQELALTTEIHQEPNASASPSSPGSSGSHGNSGSTGNQDSNNPTDSLEAPHTGDEIPWFAITVFLLGIFLTILLLYRIRAH